MQSISRGQLLALLCFFLAPQPVAALSRFRSWFPRYEAALNHVVDNNCSREFAAWNDISLRTPELIGELELWIDNSKAGPLINCILRASPEIIKANFSSAAVLLGLMPGLLALLGPSIQQTSILLALGDRPLLALIICLGSPLIGLDRELHLRGTFRALKPESTSLRLRRSLWLTCAQYLIALGAIANIAEVTWELAFQVSFSWFQGSAFLLGVWAFVGFAVHILGALALGASVSMEHDVETAGASSLSSMLSWLRWRFSFRRRDGPVRVVVQPPSFVYFLIVAFITLVTASQIIFGTILFSSILFIAVPDAVGVFCRYMASVIACRILVLMELASIRDLVEMKDADKMYQKIGQSTVMKKGEFITVEAGQSNGRMSFR